MFGRADKVIVPRPGTGTEPMAMQPGAFRNAHPPIVKINSIRCLLLAAMAAFPATSRALNSIGVKYVRSDALSASDVAGAGAFAQSNWNMAPASVGGGQGTPVPISGLKNNSGTPTGVALSSWTQTTINSWSLGDTGSANAKLLNSFSDRQPTLGFTGLDVAFPGGYSVVVYYSNNEGPSVSTLTLTGSLNDHATRSIRTGATAQCSYASVGFVQESGTVQPATASTNFTVFTGLNDAGLTLALSGANNNGICAVQLVAETALPGLPAVPAAPLPADLASNVATATTLDWADSSNATGYQVFLWPDGTAQPATPTATPPASTYDPPADLGTAITYHWQVKAVGSAGTTSGPIWSFTTAAAVAAQVSIGWNYDGLGDDTLAATELAGAPPFAQLCWNNHPGSGQAPGVVPFALNDNSGAPSGASVTAWTLSSNNSWSLGESASPNEKLLNSFADQQPSVTFSNIPVSYIVAGYSVVV